MLVCMSVCMNIYLYKVCVYIYMSVRLLSWSFGECGISLHCHYSQVLSNLKWLAVRVPPIGQIELSNHILGWKPINCANRTISVR